MKKILFMINSMGVGGAEKTVWKPEYTRKN